MKNPKFSEEGGSNGSWVYQYNRQNIDTPKD